MSKEKSEKGSFSFALGSAMVFFLKKDINEKVRKLLIGFFLMMVLDNALG